ncbi:MAG: hypothetical protein KAV18_06665, partial [Candidatus Omnitrophica bacterium]|nr:hypothetical protein [Candidatus Omnitrophota bacterium]
KITGSLDLTSPDGGQIWIVDDQEVITWVKHGSITSIDLYYSTNNGGDGYPNKINIEAVPAEDQAYPWTIPDEIGAQLKVKIVDNDGASATVSDTSSGVFEIQGSLTITAPVVSTVWEVDTAYDVVWERHGSIANAKLELSVDGGSNYTVTIANPIGAAGSPYTWTVSDQAGIITSQARVKITNLADPDNVFHETPNFKIRGRFDITFPTLDYRWPVGSTEWVTWTTHGVDITKVTLEYSSNNGGDWSFMLNASNIDNNHKKDWQVPNEPGIISTQALIKITDVTPGHDNPYKISSLFTIHGDVDITYPAGNETFDVASSETITWSVAGPVSNVRIEYSTNGGGAYTDIIASTDADNVLANTSGSYEWTPVPDLPSANCVIRISDALDSLTEDVSNVFKIKGALNLITPNGSEDFIVYDASMNAVKHEIKWYTFGSISTVNIDYSLDGGTEWINIETNYANTP